MEVDWASLKVKSPRLYCFAITIYNGAIIRNRAYYSVDENGISETGNDIIDDLIKNNLAQCFSRGYDEKQDIVKYDLHANLEKMALLYTMLSNISIFNYHKVKAFKELTAKANIAVENGTIGVKISSADYNIENLCLYFKCLQELTILESQNFILNLCKTYNLNESICLPIGDNKLYLRLIALDFSEEAFKLKLYFHFRETYNPSCFLGVFEGSPNCPLIKEILKVNGSIWGFQIAILSNGEVTYNFYLKE